MSIRDKTIDEVVNSVDRFGTVPKDQVQALVAVVARCTIELGEQMAKLSTQIEGSRTEMKDASASATRQAEALVKWTRVLVCVTAAYTILTGGLLVAAILRG